MHGPHRRLRDRREVGVGRYIAALVESELRGLAEDRIGVRSNREYDQIDVEVVLARTDPNEQESVVTLPELPGIGFVPESARSYPAGTVASAIRIVEASHS